MPVPFLRGRIESGGSAGSLRELNSNWKVKMETKEKVLNAFKDVGKPAKAGDIATATGLDKKEVSKAIKNLKTEGKLVSPKACFYSLP